MPPTAPCCAPRPTPTPVVLGAGLPLSDALPHPLRLAHLGPSTTGTEMAGTRYRVTTAST